MRPAPFQAIRIRGLLTGFLLGHGLILPLMIFLNLLWEFTGVETPDEWGTKLFLEAYACLAYLWALWLCRRALARQGFSLARFAGPGPRDPAGFTGLVILLIASGFGLSLPQSLLLLAQSKPFESGLEVMLAEPGLLAWSYNALSVCSAVVLAPLLEEILFRGIFLHRLTVKWNLRDAILVSSLIFGLLHGLSPAAIGFGLMLSLVYLESHSLRLTICAHSAYNAAVMAMSWLSAAAVLPLGEPAVMIAIESICLAGSGLFLWLWFERHQGAWQLYPPFLRPVIPAAENPSADTARENFPESGSPSHPSKSAP